MKSEMKPRKTKFKLTQQQIGRCGELLTQYELLKHGIESAALTTDSGIDLVAYVPGKRDAITIQVKTQLAPLASGGKGKAALDWWVPEDSPADLFAFVHLEDRKIWLVKKDELPDLAQQHPSGRYHFFMMLDPSAKPRRDGKRVHAYEFTGLLLENRVHEVG
jgi:hypothetical protein